MFLDFINSNSGYGLGFRVLDLGTSIEPNWAIGLFSKLN